MSDIETSLEFKKLKRLFNKSLSDEARERDALNRQMQRVSSHHINLRTELLHKMVDLVKKVK